MPLLIIATIDGKKKIYIYIFINETRYTFVASFGYLVQL